LAEPRTAWLAVEEVPVRTLIGSLSLVAVCVVAFACNKPGSTPGSATPAAASSGYPMGYPQPGQTAAYPQPAPTGYPQQGAPAGYPQQGAPAGYPQQGAATMPGAASSAAPLATPGPLALPCSSDSACGLAHCNTQFGKCAFPCVAATDCISGAQCNTMTGLCLPGGTAH
jgi:hypothetical protein